MSCKAPWIRAIVALLLVSAFSYGLSQGASREPEPAASQRAAGKNGNVLVRIPFRASGSPAPESVAISTQRGPDWGLVATAENAIFQDIDFVDSRNGFAAGELGLLLHTTDGGAHWLSSAPPAPDCSWYGIEALNARDIVASGSRTRSGEGIICWSQDGGLSWGPVLTLHPDACLWRIHFADLRHGAATTMGGSDILLTSEGGRTASSWNRVTLTPSEGWIGGDFAYLPSGELFVTGTAFHTFSGGRGSWQSRHSVDAIFDGGTEFLDANAGFTFGGTVSPAVQGWIRRTTDGGHTWGPRLLIAPYPIRTLRFGGTRRGWAAGGNSDTAGGGIWGTTDGGASWSLEIDTGAEMRGLALARIDSDSVEVFSCGFAPDGQGRIYRRRAYLPEGAASAPGSISSGEVRSFPNPFSPATTLSLFMARPESVQVDIFDPSGRVIRRLRPGFLGSGTQQIRWDGRDERGERPQSGVFFYRLRIGGEFHRGTLVLVR